MRRLPRPTCNGMRTLLHDARAKLRADCRRKSAGSLDARWPFRVAAIHSGLPSNRSRRIERDGAECTQRTRRVNSAATGAAAGSAVTVTPALSSDASDQRNYFD